jgi:hypothetical protein
VLVYEYPNGVEAEAPLLKLLRECEKDADRLARALPRPAKRLGRPPVAVIESGVGKSPAAKLRRVE